jgi:Domain of unknown function (DUF4034)
VSDALAGWGSEMNHRKMIQAHRRRPCVLGRIVSGTIVNAGHTSIHRFSVNWAVAQSRSLLSKGRYAELDQRMNGFQQDYRNGSLDEVTLLQAFGAFSIVDPALQSNFDAWIAAYPSSYAAHLARGICYFKYGVQTRGKRFIEHTTQEQIRGMRFYLSKSRLDLQTSLAMNAKPMVSYHYLIRIGMEFGELDANRALLDAALKLESVALIVRRPYLNSLETRWRGSLEAMLAFMHESRNAGLTDSQLAVLQKLVDGERERLKRRQRDVDSTTADRD